MREVLLKKTQEGGRTFGSYTDIFLAVKRKPQFAKVGVPHRRRNM
jgi:hypothetical protein